MKKKKGLCRAISMGLAVIMTVGLTACGNKSTSGKDSADASLAKQNVYSYQELDLPDMGDNVSVLASIKQEDRIYMIMEIYHWDTDGSTERMLVSLKEDGTDIQSVELKTGNTGEDADDTADTEETAGTEDTEDTEDTLLPGDVSALSSAMPISDKDAGESSIYEYTNFSSFAFGKDGKIYSVKDYSLEDYTDPENAITKNENSICVWDYEGNLLREQVMDNLRSEDEYLYIRKIIPNQEGSATIWISGDKSYKMKLDAEGNLTDRQELTDGVKTIENANDVFIREDGSVLVTYYNDNWTEMYIAEYDIETDTIREEKKLPDSFMMGGYNGISVGVTTDLVYSNSNGLYSLNIGDENSTQFMSFINSDMTTSGMYTIVMMSDTQFIGVYYDDLESRNVCALFTKRNPEDIPDKQVLVLAGNWVNWDVKNRVVSFNKESEEYRIVINDYSSYSSMDDYSAGVTQLNNDIISGKMPDILVVDNNLPMENYILKGLFANIGDLIDKDEELSREDFMENVFSAFEVNGELYYIIPSFYVSTLIGKTSMLGDRTSWNMQEFLEYAEALPEETKAFGDMTRDYFMTIAMQFCGSDFIDVSTGKCSFESPEFINLLEFCKTLPTEYDNEYYDEYYNSYQSQYRENKVVLMNSYISSLQDMSVTINGYFGEDITYVGFPSESGNGSILNGDINYALSAKSKNLDAAWQFMRYYLTDEYQEELQWGLPISRKVFEKKAQDALEKPYYIDENGKKIEYDNTFEVNGEQVTLDPLNQQQIDQLKEMIGSVEKRQYYNQEIINIITEESAPFLEGQKSAQDVAQIIQRRAQVYVDENR